MDQWIDGERARLERIALKACIRVAEDHVLKGDRIAAARYALRAADINPLDEDSAARVVRLLEQIECDREAVGVFQRHATALEAELEEAPSDEISAIAEGIRERMESEAPIPSSHFQYAGFQPKIGRRQPKRRFYEQIAVAGLSVAIFALIVSTYGWLRDSDTSMSTVPTLFLIDEDAPSPPPAGYSQMLEDMVRELRNTRGLAVRMPTAALTEDVVPPGGPVVIVRLGRADAGPDSVGVRALTLDPSTGEVLAIRREAWLGADPSHGREIAVRLATSLRNDLGAALARQRAGGAPIEAGFSAIIKERALADSLRLSGASEAARSLLLAVEAQLTNMSPAPDLLKQFGVQRASVAIDLMWLELSLPQQDRNAARAALERGVEALEKVADTDPDDLDLMTARANLLFWFWHTAPPESVAAAVAARAEARRLLETVVATAPGRVDAWAQLSSIYNAAEQYTDAYRAARFAMAIDVYAEHRMELASRLYTLALEMADTSSARQWCTYFSRGSWPRAQCELTTAFHRGHSSTSELVRLRELVSSVAADSWTAPRLSFLFAAVLGISGRESEARLLIAENHAADFSDPEIDLFRAIAALGVNDTAGAERYLDLYISAAPAKRSHVSRSRMFARLSAGPE